MRQKKTHTHIDTKVELDDTYNDDIRVTPRDLIATVEKRRHFVEEFPNFGFH